MADQQDTTAELRREPADLIQQLRGRAAFCRARGEVKTPDLLEEAATRLAAAEAQVGALREALAPVENMHSWTESAADGEAVIMTVGTVRKMRATLAALPALPGDPVIIEQPETAPGGC